MHPSFGMEFTCESTKWDDIMKGPSTEAVSAHLYKIANYQSLFGAQQIASSPLPPLVAEATTAGRTEGMLPLAA